MINYAQLEQTIRSELTQRAAAAVQSPERQKQAMQKINEYQQEPDQRDQFTDQENKDIHQDIRRVSDPGSNNDETEPRGDKDRVELKTNSARRNRYSHKRPANSGGDE